VGIGSTLCVILCDILYETPKPHGARGAFAGESLALQVGPLMGNLSMTCSDLWAIHQRKCKEW
jgi:hypothetical protein